MSSVARTVVTTAVLVPVAALLCACGRQPTGDLRKLQDLATKCPQQELVEYVGDDVSGSGLQADITATRKTALKAIATRVAVCNGHLRVDAFSGSASASRVAFDGDLKPAGATDIAKLRKVDDLVTATMKTVDAGIADAGKALPADGSDITAQFGLAAEYGKQMAASTPITLSVHLLTDGVQTVGVVLNTDSLTEATATDLANRTTAVQLPSTATVTVSGLGKTAGSPPPTSYTDAIKAFYRTYCKRTGAASCAAVTDYTG